MKPLSLGIRSPSRDWHEVVAGFPSQADAKAWLAEREALAQSNRRLQEGLEKALIALGFFSSVIKCGEPWSHACEERLQDVMDFTRAALKDNGHD